MWRLWSWLSHVLPEAKGPAGARRRLVLSHLHCQGKVSKFTDKQINYPASVFAPSHSCYNVWIIYFCLYEKLRNWILQESGESPRSQRSSRKRSKVQKRRLAEDSSDEDDGFRRGMTTRQKDTAASSTGTSISPSKRRRMATRNQPDLTYCEWVCEKQYFQNTRSFY